MAPEVNRKGAAVDGDDAVSEVMAQLAEAEAAEAEAAGLRARFEKLGLTNALIIAGAEVDANFARAARNIPEIDVLPAAGLNVYDILRFPKLLISETSLRQIEARLAPAKEGT